MKLYFSYKSFRSPHYHALVLLGCLGFVSQSANAQIPVTDGASIAQDFGQYFAEAKQWISDNAHYAEDYAMQGKQFEQQITEFKSTLSEFTSIINSINTEAMKLQGIGGQIQKVDENTYMVSQRCRTNKSLSDLAGSLIGMVSPLKNLGGDDSLDMNEIRKQQINVCVAMQQTRNKKFNASLEFVKNSLPQMEKAQKDLKDQRDKSDTPGKQGDTSSDAALLSDALQQQMRGYQANMAAYDGYLASLQNTQVTLAEMALKGPGTSLLGTTVRTTALMKALDVDAGDIVP